ncbi:hypothetical protein ACKP2L_05390 [Oenococcus alcoholitolerans]|uniref:hypothetical protein n=1 Tax=Oenococcus alcoholitolerans TaxID=931074 RepID=UPI003F7219D8
MTRYLVQNKEEYDYIAKRLDKQGYKWQGYSLLPNPLNGFPTVIDTGVFKKRVIYDLDPSDYDFKVSDLMKPNKDVIYMTPAEKAEFDELKNNYVTLLGALHEGIWSGALYTRICRNKDYQESNQAQLEFARAWADPDLIVVKDEPRFAYKLKPKFNCVLDVVNKYLSIDEIRVSKPEFHTAEEWQAIDNELKQIFDRVAEK